MEDKYKELKSHTTGIYKEKGSKFIAYAYPVYSEQEVKEKLEEVRKLEYAARHHCYAYTLHPDKSAWRANDDGEPANTAGKPILGQIQSNDLSNVLIVVVRYFGGVKLGVGGLITAYRAAAADALGSITITPNAFFEMGQAQIVPENCSAVSFKGWATSTGSNEFKIAICKLTPVADNTSNRTAERVKEIVLTGLSSNNKLIAIDETTFAVASDADISAGDIIFPMIKETTGGSEIYMNLTIKTTTY